MWNQEIGHLQMNDFVIKVYDEPLLCKLTIVHVHVTEQAILGLTCKKGSDWLKSWDGSSAQYLRCKVFPDWSIINIYLLHFLKQHLTAFVDKVYWCLRRKGPCILILSCRNEKK